MTTTRRSNSKPRVETDETDGLTDEAAPAKSRRARPMPTAASASGAGGGAAVTGEPREGGRRRAMTAMASGRWRPQLPAADRSDEGDEPPRTARRQPTATPAPIRRQWRAAAAPPRTPRRTPPAWRSGGRSGRIDRRRTRRRASAPEVQRRGCRFRWSFGAELRSRVPEPAAEPEPQRAVAPEPASSAGSAARAGQPSQLREASRAERARCGERSGRTRRAAPFHRPREGQLPDLAAAGGAAPPSKRSRNRKPSRSPSRAGGNRADSDRARSADRAGGHHRPRHAPAGGHAASAAASSHRGPAPRRPSRPDTTKIARQNRAIFLADAIWKSSFRARERKLEQVLAPERHTPVDLSSEPSTRSWPGLSRPIDIDVAHQRVARTPISRDDRAGGEAPAPAPRRARS